MTAKYAIFLVITLGLDEVFAENSSETEFEQNVTEPSQVYLSLVTKRVSPNHPPQYRTDKNSSEIKYWILAQISADKFLNDTKNDRKHVVARVERVQQTTPYMTTIKFFINPTGSSKLRPKNCSSVIVDRPWEDSKTINVACDVILVKSYDVDKENPRYKELAQRSVDIYNKKNQDLLVNDIVSVALVVDEHYAVNIVFKATSRFEPSAFICFAEVIEPHALEPLDTIISVDCAPSPISNDLK